MILTFGPLSLNALKYLYFRKSYVPILENFHSEDGEFSPAPYILPTFVKERNIEKMTVYI